MGDMKKPFFSVITPLHNSAAFVRDALDSVTGQGFMDYELICICDACTDNTAEIAKEYAERMIITDYGKAGMARNAGLDVARGEWVLFLDDDDWYLPGAFSIIAEELKNQKDIDILAYGFDWQYIGKTYQVPGCVKPAVWSKAWRREFVGNTRFPDWIHTDDLGFTNELLPKARIGFLFEILYYYNFMRPGSVSEKIRDGAYDNNQLPEKARTAAEGYERWLKNKEF